LNVSLDDEDTTAHQPPNEVEALLLAETGKGVDTERLRRVE